MQNLNLEISSNREGETCKELKAGINKINKPLNKRKRIIKISENKNSNKPP